MRTAPPGRLLRALLSATLLGALVATPAAARWATDDDAAWEIEYQNVDTVVHADGTWEDVTETRTRVLKDSARTRVAIQRWGYNANIQTFEVQEAYTVIGGRTVPVDAGRIEDKPMASTPFGFDETHQVMIPFPEVEVGASVVTKVRRVTKEVGLRGLWSSELLFGVATRQRAGRVTVRSERPLFVDTNDPAGILDVARTDGGATVRVTLTAPVQRVPIDENGAWLEPASISWVAMSTERDWTNAVRPTAAEYARVLSAPLPPRLDAIRVKAAAVGDEVDRLNLVTSELAAQLHYLGDWRTTRGRFVPRDLAAVAETGSGDCKDFATATTAILRALGVHADVAWTRRGTPYRRLPVASPLTSDFNHAIVHVTSDRGERWLDPTNPTSFAQGTPPDVAGRPALVVTGAAAELRATPAVRPADGEVRMTRLVHFAAGDRLTVDGTLALRGAAAIGYTGAELTRSKRSVDFQLAGFFGNEDELREWTLDPYDLSSRVVRDLEFRAHMVERDAPMRTSAGDAYYLGNGGSVMDALLTPTNERVSGLVIGTPYVFRSTTELRDVRRIGDRSLDCELTSPWVAFTRTVTDVPHGIRIEDRAELRAEVIPNAELQSHAFADLQARIRACLTAASVVYERLTPTVDADAAGLTAPDAPAAEAAELPAR